jgi:threonine-phosphate decarboxylase
MLYGHGDDGYRYGREIVADFSTNVYWGGEPAGLKEHVFSQWKSVNRYPEVLAESFRDEVAAFHGLSSGQVLVCNGTAEAIYLIAQVFNQSRTTIAIPTFSEYEDAGRLHGHRISFVDWEMLKKEVALIQFTATDLFFLCNPNNPTGDVLSLAAIRNWLQLHPDTVLVLDEAYMAFTQATQSAISLLGKFSNLIILRSLTKTFAIPGLRLGYVLASAALIDRLTRAKYPWSVNCLSVEAGKYILQHFNDLQPPVEQMLTQKRIFAQAVAELSGYEVGESHTHYFLVRMADRSAFHLKSFLMERYGLLIRDAANFRGLGAGHFRVATLSPEKNNLLIQALRTWMKDG